MESNKEDSNKKINAFKEKKLSVDIHPPKNNEFNQDNIQITESEKGIKKPRRKTVVEQEENIRRLKEVYLKNKRSSIISQEYNLINSILPNLIHNSVEFFLKNSKNELVNKILNVLTINPRKRSGEDEKYLLAFLLYAKINEVLKSDILITELPIQSLFQYFKHYIFGKCCNFMDTIFSSGQEADNLYIVLHGSVGQYKLEVYDKELTAEEYYLFLAESYALYEEELYNGKLFLGKDKRKSLFENNNINNSPESPERKEKEIQHETVEDDENSEGEFQQNIGEYIDHYLLFKIIDENKDIYPLMDISDLVRLKKIIFKIKLHMKLNENKKTEAQLLCMIYELPETY